MAKPSRSRFRLQRTAEMAHAPSAESLRAALGSLPAQLPPAKSPSGVVAAQVVYLLTAASHNTAWTIDRLAKRLGTDENAVRKAARRLVEAGLVTTYYHRRLAGPEVVAYRPVPLGESPFAE